MSYQVLGHAMIQLLGIKQLGQPAKVGFNREALVPAAARTMLEIARWRAALAQSLVGQRDGLPVISQRPFPKHVIRRISRAPSPINHLATVVDQPGQLDAHNPAPVRDALLANLALAAAFAPWMDQLDANRVQDREKRRLSQKLVCQLAIVCDQ